MRAVGVVMVNELLQDDEQVVSTQYQHSIRAFSANATLWGAKTRFSH
jgi:hypothetical protein